MPELRGRSRMPSGLVFFVLSYLVVCSAMALRQGNSEFMAYAGAMVVFIGVVMALHARVRFSATALWLLALWGLMHMAGGTVPIPESWADADSARPVLYALRPFDGLPRYDQITHAYGFFTATVASWEATRVLLQARPGPALSSAAVLMGMGLGALNEVIEFAVTLFVENHGVGGYTNTGWDLVSNMLGALTAGVWCLGRR